MFRDSVLPILRELVPPLARTARRMYKFAMTGESVIEEAVGNRFSQFQVWSSAIAHDRRKSIFELSETRRRLSWQMQLFAKNWRRRFFQPMTKRWRK